MNQLCQFCTIKIRQAALVSQSGAYSEIGLGGGWIFAPPPCLYCVKIANLSLLFQFLPFLPLFPFIDSRRRNGPFAPPFPPEYDPEPSTCCLRP